MIQNFINKLRSLYNQKSFLAYCRLRLLVFIGLIKKGFRSAPDHFSRILHNLSRQNPLDFFKLLKVAIIFVPYNFRRIIHNLPKLSSFAYFGKSRILVIITSLVLITIAVIGFSTIHNKIYEPNITKTTTVFIPTGSTYRQVTDSLKHKDIFRDFKSFNWFAKRKNYPALIKPGAFEQLHDYSSLPPICKLRV